MQNTRNEKNEANETTPTPMPKPTKPRTQRNNAKRKTRDGAMQNHTTAVAVCMCREFGFRGEAKENGARGRNGSPICGKVGLMMVVDSDFVLGGMLTAGLRAVELEPEGESGLAFYWHKSEVVGVTFYWSKPTGGGEDRIPGFLLAQSSDLGFLLAQASRRLGLFTGPGSGLGFLLAQAPRPRVLSEGFRQFFLPLRFLLPPPTMPHGPIT
ncbi:hypothetical protein BS47DRAFT_1384501 [Hydnum rufescens UP504]|uniref:Uncharacterized protein n=1 Tax=Hydnum rufescens UP504 TaxID=1448309 RepID=A0A9P6DS46_9AGAM|nr:hypothetical protein BS47DRAFT_1384501 [Hydnum rufescens UP504]